MKIFGNLYFYMREFQVPKALFCGNINAALLTVFQLQGRLQGSNTLALYAFLWSLQLHTFNYTIITYGYCSIRSQDKYQ